MLEQIAPLADYLTGDDIVQVDDERIQALAGELRAGHGADTGLGGAAGLDSAAGLDGAGTGLDGRAGPGTADVDFARRAFEHVRDSVAHSFDADDPRVTVAAREVLDGGVGLCYAKSILLAAVLRAGGIPTALCYQWLVDDDYFMLHGLVAVHLDGGWHRQDPRGNKPGVDAQFSLAEELLAWPVRAELGERDLPALYVSPPPELVAVLRSVDDVRVLGQSGLGIVLADPGAE